MPKDLQKTYNFFLSNLDGRMAVITTPFTKLDCFYIKFDILQLPHLLGLHKIYNDSPKIICQKLKNKAITYKHLQRHRNFGLIKDRVELFEFILEIFLEGYNDSVIYVSEADRFGSSMKLDIAFSHPHKNKILTLGLREISNSVYAPVTFYVSKSNRPIFPKSKRAKILTLEMIAFNL
ncbi:TPA: hypothetical protein IU076_000542 [Enterococcus faecalis]|uniref:PBECR4 domain-containing protein n=1 Tax=Enterococcus faecalis TaxID=1351 RepID=UPI0019E7C1D1|nr:PBECR4 domain-containing protein [Enterococcus faecalis]EGO8492625.1 hypothetical protein [Enterococcus faecalis]HAP5650594.1 hypothetical protein [Enterococcus faecalis]